MGLFSRKSNQDVCNEYILKLRRARSKGDCIGDLTGSVKAFDKAYRELGSGEITPSMMLMDALMADCAACCGKKVPFGYRKDQKSIDERYAKFKNSLAQGPIDEEKLAAAELASQVWLEYQKHLNTFLMLDTIYKMKLSDLLPAELVERLAEKNPELFAETDSKAAESSPEAETKDDEFMFSNLSGVLKDADERYAQTGNPDIYHAICSEGALRYGSERCQGIALQAAARYNAAVDAMAQKGQITEKNMSILFEQRKVNVKLAQEGFIAFMSRAADALRDGYEDIPQDLLTARTYYIHAAKEGDRHALLYYGIFCKNGIGGPVNADGAASAFARVIKEGDDIIAARAYYHLSEMFEKGIGISQDAESAKSSLELAEQLGWDELAQKIHDTRAQLGQYYKEYHDNKEIVGEILGRFKDPDTGSIDLPALY